MNIPIGFEPRSEASILDHRLHAGENGANVFLYESQVWRVMITYGGIILSFIMLVTAEQHPEEGQSVHDCS